jgi:hypothetical protein
MLLVLSSIPDQRYAESGVVYWRAKGATADVITTFTFFDPDGSIVAAVAKQLKGTR